MAEQQRELITVQEAMARYGVLESNMRYWLAKAKVRKWHRGRRVLVDAAEIGKKAQESSEIREG